MRLLGYLAIAIMALLIAYGVWVFPGKQVQPVGEIDFVGSQGEQIAYYSSGEGPVVILLASLGRSVSDFNVLVPALNQAGYRTISVESRGIGRSEVGDLTHPSLYVLADDIEAVLEKELKDGTSLVHLVGHAFGNRVARAYANKYPQRVDGIALLASGGAQRLTDMPDVLAAMRGCFKWWNPPPVRQHDIRYAFFAGSNPIPDDWLKGWHLKASKIQVAAVATTPEREWRDAGGKAPILVLQGSHDRIAPAKLTSEKLQAQFPNRVTVLEIKNAGHALLPEAPDDIATALVDFFASKAQQPKNNMEENNQ